MSTIKNINPDERKLVEDHYATRGAVYIAKILGVPEHRIRKVATALGIKMDPAAKKAMMVEYMQSARTAKRDKIEGAVPDAMREATFSAAAAPCGVKALDLYAQFKRETASKYLYRMVSEGKLYRRISGVSGVLEYRYFTSVEHADAYSRCETKDAAQDQYSEQLKQRERDRNNGYRRAKYRKDAEYREKKCEQSRAKKSKPRDERSVKANRPWVGQKTIPQKRQAWSGAIDMSRAKITIAPTPKPRFDPTDTAESVFSSLRPGQYLVGGR